MKIVCGIIVFLFSFCLNAQEIINPDLLPDVEDYIFVQSNPEADTVIIALHGGPTDELYEGSFEFMESIETFSVVEILKHEMMTEVLSNDLLTFEEGVAVNDTTVALIEKVVQYYNEQFKTVVLLGHSWGAIILGEYMDDYGVDNIHKIIPMEGRLSVQQEFVDYLLDGYLPTFAGDGTTIIPGLQGIWDQGLLSLGAAAFANRWTDSLAGMDLSKMMYTYAENDGSTGSLIDVEIDFLNDVGAEILAIPNEDHGASFEVQYQQMIVDFIRGNSVMTSTETIVQNKNFRLFPTLANRWIQVEFEKPLGNLRIFDFSGSLIYESSDLKSGDRIDVSEFPTGQYVAIVQNESNNVQTERFQIVK